MGRSQSGHEAQVAHRERSFFDIAVAIVNLVLFALFVNALYLHAARACPNPDEGRMILTWQGGNMTPSKWPTWSVILPYFFYRYLGVTSVEGLQQIGMVISVVGAAWVNYLVYARFGLDRFTRAIVLLAFNSAILSGSGELYSFQFFARWGVLSYPLRIFAGAVFLYVLISFSQGARTPGLARTAALGALMVALVYFHYILALPVFAACGALCIVRLVRRQFALRPFRQWIVPVFFLFILPIAAGILVMWLDAHPQMTTPRISLKDGYFFRGDSYEKNVTGYLEFLLMRSKNLAYEIAFPFAWVPRSLQFMTAISWGPLVLISIGLAGSFFRRNEVRFVVATFLVLDLTLRIFVNFFEWFPYGTVRYALSQVFAFQLMAGLGLVDVLALAGVLVSRAASAPAAARLRAALAVTLIAGMATVALAGGFHESVDQRAIALKFRTDAQTIKSEFGSLRGAAIIMTDDQENLIIADLLGETFYKENTILKFSAGTTRGKPFNAERAKAIRDELSRREEFHTITFGHISEENYGSTANGLVTSEHVLVSERRLWNLYFGTWRRSLAKAGRSP